MAIEFLQSKKCGVNECEQLLSCMLRAWLTMQSARRLSPGAFGSASRREVRGSILYMASRLRKRLEHRHTDDAPGHCPRHMPPGLERGPMPGALHELVPCQPGL